MRPTRLLSVLLLLAGCSEPQKAPRLSEALPNIPVPPNSEVIAREGGEDALQIRFHSSLEPDQIATYYRGVLSRDPWRLISDTKAANGGVALYAEQQGPSLWVTIRKAEGGSGTIVELAGAKARGR
jgi:hypothetical protein